MIFLHERIFILDFFCNLIQPVTSSLDFVMMQYKNVRPDYLKNIWKVINWKYASDEYERESA